MRLVGASSSISTVTRRASESRSAPAEPQPRALITIDAPHPNERLPQPTRHPVAPFVAHLIATRMRAPQTRERRRAEPEEATAVYRSMTKPVTQKRMFGARV